jgi:hypothetical protein
MFDLRDRALSAAHSDLAFDHRKIAAQVDACDRLPLSMLNEMRRYAPLQD